MCFLLNSRKLLLLLNGKTDQKANKTALAVRIFDANNIPARSLCASGKAKAFMSAGWLQNYWTSLIQTPNTFENRNVINYNVKIFTRIHVLSAQKW